MPDHWSLDTHDMSPGHWTTVYEMEYNFFTALPRHERHEYATMCVIIRRLGGIRTGSETDQFITELNERRKRLEEKHRHLLVLEMANSIKGTNVGSLATIATA